MKIEHSDPILCMFDLPILDWFKLVELFRSSNELERVRFSMWFNTDLLLLDETGAIVVRLGVLVSMILEADEEIEDIGEHDDVDDEDDIQFLSLIPLFIIISLLDDDDDDDSDRWFGLKPPVLLFFNFVIKLTGFNFLISDFILNCSISFDFFLKKKN